MSAEQQAARDLVHSLLDVGTEAACHVYAGSCPEPGRPDARDEECAVCQLLVRAEAWLRGAS